ncbi:MAG TPA: glycosyltransferase family 87 protein, partial [Candidatus Dormibacteraeota bacterium]|nr:glycosyltransferase family 87 protein [Candidatus Dormibacteraeota bacterium]
CVWFATSGMSVRTRVLALALLLTSYPAFQALIEGQWSFVLLLAALAALAAARRGRDVPAGLALAVLWLKPPLLLLMLLWLLIARRWRMAGSAVAGALVLTVVALPWTGASSTIDYFSFLGGVGASHVTGAGAVGATQWEGGLLGMEGLLGVAATVAGQQHPVAVDVLTGVLSVLLVAVFVVAAWPRLRRGAPSIGDGIAALCLGLVLDPHLYAQDCVLLIVALPLLLRGGIRVRSQAALILGLTGVVDLTALDTLWSPGTPLFPPHLFTAALVVTMVVMLVRQRGEPVPASPDARALASVPS